MLLGGNGVVMRFADDRQVGDVEFIATWRSAVGTDNSPNDEGGLLTQVIRSLKHLVTHGRLGHHRLDEAGAVADSQKVDLPTRSAVSEPTAQCDFLTFMVGDLVDVGGHRDRTSEAHVSESATVPSRTEEHQTASRAPLEGIRRVRVDARRAGCEVV